MAPSRPQDENVLVDEDIRNRISALIDEEHELRDRLGVHDISADEQRARLTEVEAALDQCWDLLRQRRARREFGEDPDAAHVRPVTEVEGYQQ